MFDLFSVCVVCFACVMSCFVLCVELRVLVTAAACLCGRGVESAVSGVRRVVECTHHDFLPPFAPPCLCSHPCFTISTCVSSMLGMSDCCLGRCWGAMTADEGEGAGDGRTLVMMQQRDEWRGEGTVVYMSECNRCCFSEQCSE